MGAGDAARYTAGQGEETPQPAARGKPPSGTIETSVSWGQPGRDPLSFPELRLVLLLIN